MRGLSTRAATLLLAGIPLVCVLIVSLPEVLRDRIFPFDSALIAANGALFASLFADLGTFFSAPVDWLWGYYDQYPALSVRRHPPLFGFVAGLIYSVTGVSAMQEVGGSIPPSSTKLHLKNQKKRRPHRLEA